MISVVLADSSAFGALFECLFNDDEVVRMRAADGLEKVARNEPRLFASYRQRLLTEVAKIDQPSVQWHLAQILAEIELTPRQRDRAVRILKRNLERYDDWIVINLTLEALAHFAREDARLRRELIPILHHRQSDPRKAVAERATKLLGELQVRDHA